MTSRKENHSVIARAAIRALKTGGGLFPSELAELLYSYKIRKKSQPTL